MKIAPVPDTLRPPRADIEAHRYHHGALKPALLAAAELILKRDGIEALSLRAAAREAGVSHAAPKNHFGDLRGLLSDLAAVGFQRFRATMAAEVVAHHGTLDRLDAIGIGYVTFAKQNPELFTLMFRSERLDFGRPTLKEANEAAFSMLALTAADGARSSQPQALNIEQAARIAAAWSMVHGFACLMLDGRMRPLLDMTTGRPDELAIIKAIMGRAKKT